MSSLAFPLLVLSNAPTLLQVGELIGGSQREERLEYLEARLDDLKLNKDGYWWYLDLRRYGSGELSFCLIIYSDVKSRQF